MEKNENTITIFSMIKKIFNNRKIFYWVLPITFVVSCIWILPQPRRYKATIKLAPETANGNPLGNFSSIASTFGVNLGVTNSDDAIYPILYPELFKSPEFVNKIYNCSIQTNDGKCQTTYFDYLKNHQKKNWLTYPFKWVIKQVLDKISSRSRVKIHGDNDSGTFYMEYDKQELMLALKEYILCDVDKTSNVITLSVTDQDPLVAATMVDSIQEHLQNFIIAYRTQKVKVDMDYYHQLADEAECEYMQALEEYSRFCDSHTNIILQSEKITETKLEENVTLKQQLYLTLATQYQTAKIKVQEATPSFTTLRSNVVPHRPFAPKRMIFVLVMMIIATCVVCCYILWEDIQIFYSKFQV